jgi:hypothetical protein
MAEKISLSGVYFTKESDAVDFFNKNGVWITNSHWKGQRQFVEGCVVFPSGNIGFWVVPLLLKREEENLKKNDKVTSFVENLMKEFDLEDSNYEEIVPSPSFGGEAELPFKQD